MHEVSSNISTYINSQKLIVDLIKDLSNLSRISCSKSNEGLLHHCDCTLLIELLVADLVMDYCNTVCSLTLLHIHLCSCTTHTIYFSLIATYFLSTSLLLAHLAKYPIHMLYYSSYCTFTHLLYIHVSTCSNIMSSKHK